MPNSTSTATNRPNLGQFQDRLAVSSCIMHCQTPPKFATSFLLPRSDLTCKLGFHRRPLRKFAVFNRAATPGSYRARQKPSASRQAEQLSQLAKEVFEMALQSGPRGFTRSMQAANAFASIGRYMMLHIAQVPPNQADHNSRKDIESLIAHAASMPTACGRGEPFLLKLFSDGCLRNLVQHT